MEASIVRNRAPRRWLRLAAALAASAALAAAANPLKTDKGNPIRNLQYFPDGVVVNNIQIFPPGWVAEDGTGPPGKATSFQDVGKEWTAEEKKKITDETLKAHPGVKAVGDPSKVYDCHGFTFKSKKMRIFNEAIDTILADQGWALAEDKKHKKGDVVVYRDDLGRVTHTGIVEEVAGGNVTKVRSKWGRLGEYVHDVKDVPASYGTKVEVRTGGKPLADPPIEPEDVNVFKGIQPPPLKAVLSDPFVAPVTEGYLSSNAVPMAELKALGHGPQQWQYGLLIPQLGLQVSPGDTLRLYGSFWTGAQVSGAAASSAFGAWKVQEVLPDSIIFDATMSAFISGNLDGLVDGFTGMSIAAPEGTIVYTEAIAGSVGLVAGPVPEPGTAALVVLGLLAMGLVNRRRGLRATMTNDRDDLSGRDDGRAAISRSAAAQPGAAQLREAGAR